MNCPDCNSDNTKVIDSRPSDWGVKRIRKCIDCGYKFATIEIREITDEAIESLKVSQYLIDCRSNSERKVK